MLPKNIIVCILNLLNKDLYAYMYIWFDLIYLSQKKTKWLVFKYNIDYIVKFNLEIPEVIEWHGFIEDLENEKYKIK